MFQEQSVRLDQLLIQVGRKPSDVKRTATFPVFCWRNTNERQHIEDALLSIPQFSQIPRATVWDIIRTRFGGVIGSPDEIIQHFDAYKASGIEEIIIQYITLETTEPFHVFAETVLGHFH